MNLTPALLLSAALILSVHDDDLKTLKVEALYEGKPTD